MVSLVLFPFFHLDTVLWFAWIPACVHMAEDAFGGSALLRGTEAVLVRHG